MRFIVWVDLAWSGQMANRTVMVSRMIARPHDQALDMPSSS